MKLLRKILQPRARDSDLTELTSILLRVRELLSLPDANFDWSSWPDAPTAIREIDRLLSKVENGAIVPASEIRFLFFPTGPIQEVSLSSGWADEFLDLADRIDLVLGRM